MSQTVSTAMPPKGSTVLADRPVGPGASVPAPPSHDVGSRPGTRRLPSRRSLLDLAVLLPLLSAAAVLQAWGMFRSPARIDDEGTYVAQAWAVLNLGELTHYTYWYDHPPLGWLQIAGYAALTNAFDRAPNAVAAGREFTLLVAVVSAALVWVLARRLAMPRWAAGLAVGLFAFSPLAVEYHRFVFLDNIATPWLLGAFALALSPRRHLGAYAGAAFCFGIAVLTKETTLLLLPVLVWVLWRQSTGGIRRYAVTVAAAVLALTGTFYIAFALIKGEVLPAVNSTSLVEGVLFQLSSRESSGSIFSPGTLGNTTVNLWLDLDQVLPALALLATPVALFVRRLRPFAVGMVIMLAMLVRPGGYLPVPFVIALIPFGALLVAGVLVVLVRFSSPRLGLAAARLRNRGPILRPAAALVSRPLVPIAVGVLVAAAVGATLSWPAPYRSSVIGPLDKPLTEATEYVAANAEAGERVLTDDAVWVDLVTAGLRREDVVWYYKPDTDPAVPSGVESYAWVVATDSMRNSIGSTPTVTDALQQGVRVASFGDGDQRVDILRIPAGGADAPDDTEAAVARTEAGAALARNPRLTTTENAAAALTSGLVDVRLMTVLAVATDRFALGFDLPALPGEEQAGQLRRVALIDSLDGAPLQADDPDLAELELLFADQVGALGADVALVPAAGDGGAMNLRVTYDLVPRVAP